MAKKIRAKPAGHFHVRGESTVRANVMTSHGSRANGNRIGVEAAPMMRKQLPT